MSVDLTAALWITVIGLPVLVVAMVALVAVMYALTAAGRSAGAAAENASRPPAPGGRSEREQIAVIAAAIVRAEARRAAPPRAVEMPGGWRLSRRMARLSVGAGRKKAR